MRLISVLNVMNGILLYGMCYGIWYYTEKENKFTFHFMLVSFKQ